jgi:uncharacterized membrane protein SpoIIM required for sporulation
MNIAWNNLQITLKLYTFGIVFGLPTLYILFVNGMMLGAFQYMFFAKGLGWASILVIWIHGTLEMNSLIIEATAGLILGTNFLFPGTYTRMQAMINGGKESVKLLVVLLPIVVIAAILESYVTRLTHLPVWCSILILVLSWAFLIGYFLVWPWILKKRKVEFINGELLVNKVPQE